MRNEQTRTRVEYTKGPRGTTETKDNCLCGQHVHKGTFIIGIILLVLGLLSLFNGIWPSLFGIGEQEYVMNGNHTQRNGTTRGGDPFAALVNAGLGLTRGLGLGFGILSLIFTALMLYGNRKRKPVLYWPYLALQIINIILMVVLLVFLIGSALLMFVSPSSFGMKSPGNILTAVIALAISLGIALLFAIQVYFFFIVPNRSRKLMTEELREPTVTRVGQHTTVDVPITQTYQPASHHQNPNFSSYASP